MTLIDILRDPRIKGLSPDATDTALIHRQIVKEKPLLLSAYKRFYSVFLDVTREIPAGHLVELGSGIGLLKEFIPNLITTDVLPLPHLDRVMSAEQIEFEDGSVSAFFMLDVFHHLQNPGKFLQEVERCLKPSGRLVMIEPANTVWGRFVRNIVHDEVYDENSKWESDGSRPMSDANIALPWIVFDRDIFETRFTGLEILSYRAHTPLRFLLSGGIQFRSPIPRHLAPLVDVAEWVLAPFGRVLGMHLTIDVVRTVDLVATETA
jgi:SAM-dependent methyltransferase